MGLLGFGGLCCGGLSTGDEPNGQLDLWEAIEVPLGFVFEDWRGARVIDDSLIVLFCGVPVGVGWCGTAVGLAVEVKRALFGDGSQSKMSGGVHMSEVLFLGDRIAVGLFGLVEELVEFEGRAEQLGSCGRFWAIGVAGQGPVIIAHDEVTLSVNPGIIGAVEGIHDMLCDGGDISRGLAHFEGADEFLGDGELGGGLGGGDLWGVDAVAYEDDDEQEENEAEQGTRAILLGELWQSPSEPECEGVGLQFVPPFRFHKVGQFNRGEE